MSRLLKKLFFIFLPIGVYFGIFVYFEPYNYFGIKTKNYDPDSAIVRVRNYMQDPADVIILGDSRMAHFDMDTVGDLVGEPVGQLSFGGAAFNESMDLLEFAMDKNPNLKTVYFGASFYTLNESYYKDRMSSIEKTAENPFAYILNFNYNIEMLNNIKNTLSGSAALDEKEIGHWTQEDYLYPDGTQRPFRKNLEEYADTIYSVCENYKSDTADIERYITLLKRCREKGITVYTVLPPMDRSIRELVVDKLGIGPDILEFIDSVKDYSQVLNFEYVDDDPFTEYNFYDGFHLDMETGLPIFTKMLFER